MRLCKRYTGRSARAKTDPDRICDLLWPGAKDVFRDQKDGSGGAGYYWPVPAVWRSGGADPEFHQNGVYLSHLAALVFSGKKIATKVCLVTSAV